MRKFVAFIFVVMTVLAATPASAVSWTVTPGGSFTASGGDVSFFFPETGAEWYCGSLTIPGVAATSGNPVAVVPTTPGVQFADCDGPLGLSPDYVQLGDWTVQAQTYDPVADTVTGTVQDVSFQWLGPGCEAFFNGYLDFRYDNATGQFEILPNATITDIWVDP